MSEDPEVLPAPRVRTQDMLGGLIAQLTIGAIRFDQLARIKARLEGPLTREEKRELADAYWEYIDRIERALQLQP